MKLKRIIPISIYSVIALTSCQKHDGINVFEPVDVDGWAKTDSVTFNIPNTEKSKEYEFSVQCRITRNYAFKDLWLEVMQEYGDSAHHTTIIDTLCMTLADDNGNFNGNGRSLLEYQEKLRKIILREDDQATIRISHIMNEDPLKGIHDIGILLTPLQTISASVDTKENEEQDGESPQGGTSVTEEG